MRHITNILTLILLLAVCCIVSCSDSKEQDAMNHAESVMESRPDSALQLLQSIDTQQLSGKREKAHYALLMSMALDKNYIDTTTFDVLQPAIDYYLDHGSPDEKLRTYYYQGRVFQNQGDKDRALNSFVKGTDISYNATDSLCIARTLIASACIYYAFYDFNGYVENYLNAASIYNKKSQKDDELDCLIQAFNGTIILEDKMRADSLYRVCNSFPPTGDMQLEALRSCNLSYVTTFGTKQSIEDYIDHLDPESDFSSYEILNLVYAYHKTDDNNNARLLLDAISEGNVEFDTLKYQSVAVAVLKSLGDYKNALSIYQDYSHKSDSINCLKFDQKSKSIEEKHRIELNARNEAIRHSRIAWGLTTGIIILVLAILLLVRDKKAKEEIAREKLKTKEAENAKLKIESGNLTLEKEQLALENTNLQLERDKKTLEAENLSHRVEALENERESLKAIIEAQEGVSRNELRDSLPEEVRKVIKVRIEMLNALLASYISENDRYGQKYETWVKELTENIGEFMNSSRLAFQASHPEFIQYFENHGLTVEEINYVCIYAMGLHGKEVGKYMRKRSHVNTSSAIRKKLGLDKRNTNIGIYVRNLLNTL